ncbi:DUF2269 domain-containing protein [Catellatospora citrea]|uniref:DUF2269 domain-containing protein n=1 Tax=Catellatospora citrea TaxID=53366 RepID=A0A8J3K9C3_9ACTN|nr:DUF2269 domain-containing protein [Catellatospora citrea]RKE10458.1 hypothetical protein C8E86_5360 [Catellatospora citrea]GIF99036.1 hypothetical protein Cci01nite_41300 [Catellatospora citrea]
MPMPPRLRKTALTAHVTTSLGWLGAVAAFLAMAVAGLTTDDAERAHALYLAADLVTWTIIVPLALASFTTGLIQSLGTPWGLLRHYWVLAKLILTIPATAVLLLHTRPIGVLATSSDAHAGDLHGLRIQLVADAVAAIVVLLAATVLAVFKPRGTTGYGQRRAQQATAPPP